MIDASQFRPVDDDLLAERALLERVETKFVFRPDELEVFLGRLGSADYGLVLGENSGLSEYKNLYFDSADRRFLREHHRGRRLGHLDRREACDGRVDGHPVRARLHRMGRRAHRRRGAEGRAPLDGHA